MVAVYLLILVSYMALYVVGLPNVIRQAASFRAKMPDIEVKLNELRTSYTKKYPNAARLFNFEIESPMLSVLEIGDWNAFIRSLNATNSTAARVRESLPAKLLVDLALLGASDVGPADLAQNQTEAPKPDVIVDQRVNSVGIPGPSVSPGNGAIEGPVSTSTEETPPPSIDPAQAMEALVGAMNERVIGNRDFFRNSDFDFANTAEPPNGLAAVWEKAQKQGRSSLSDRDCQKLNRRVLEPMFPIGQRGYHAEKKIDEGILYARGKVQQYLPNIALYLLKFFGNSLLAILFSFLIVMDYARLSKEVRGLARSKLSDFFVEAGQPVVKFAISVGQGFQALATIAFITTIMVVVVLFALGVSSIAFLAVITFLTSLVPVIGIFFEVVPVLLVALNERGPVHAFWALIALLVIHVIIGYVITPIIFGRRFKLNVVAILFILFIGNQLAGVWGMILGVPIANYLLRDVLGVPNTTDDKQQEGDGPSAAAPLESVPEITGPPPAPSASPAVRRESARD